MYETIEEAQMALQTAAFDVEADHGPATVEEAWYDLAAVAIVSDGDAKRTVHKRNPVASR